MILLQKAVLRRTGGRTVTGTIDLAENPRDSIVAIAIEIADDATEVSALFDDIVGFTPLTADMSASDLIGLLNDVFRTLDDLVDDLELEKIKTVGDEYMVAAGVPRIRTMPSRSPIWRCGFEKRCGTRSLAATISG